MKAVCIVQARRRSTRLPDKILKPLAGKAALLHTLQRCKAIKGIDEVICAGVDDPFEQPVFDIAQAAGVSSFAGDEKDVLSRYYHAAKKAGADIVMRVTSDCPLLDPGVCGDLVAMLKNTNADYVSNSGFPHGLDCEVFYFKNLEEAYKNAHAAIFREHVTLWIGQNTQTPVGVLHFDKNIGYLREHYRWVLDYPEDYAFLQGLFDHFDPGKGILPWIEVVKIQKKNAVLSSLNEKCIEMWKKNDVLIRQEAQLEGHKERQNVKSVSQGTHSVEHHYWSITHKLPKDIF